MRFDLKLSDGRVVQWDGDDGEDACVRYCDAQRVAGRAVTVIAWRWPRVAVVPLERHARFIEP